MNISVTGGGGFIGRRLVDVLCRQGHSVKMLSRHSALQVPPGVHVEKGDLASKDCPLDGFVEKCAVVFHCAGEIRSEKLMRLLHVDATQRLIDAVLNEASRTGRVIHWVQLSSVGAYGPPPGKSDSNRVVTEETDTRPVGEYEITKTISDELVVQACRGGMMTYSIVRPSNVFGENMTNQSLHGLGNMIRKRMFFYIGKPGAIATYVHVDDVVEVLLRCGMDQRARGGVFNISNDCLLEEMVNSIAIALNVAPPRIRLPEYLVRVAVALVTKIYPIPLTQKRINALISRTRYPCHKLESELDYKPKIYVPGSVGEALFQ
jgi:nucleoside-diphosphate-sugar epimerase